MYDAIILKLTTKFEQTEQQLLVLIIISMSNVINRVIPSSQSLPPKPFYVYLSTEGLDSIIRYTIVPAGVLGSPWFYAFLRDSLRRGDAMHTIINYGLVMSAIKLARIIGSDVLFHIPHWRDNHKLKELLSFLLTFLAISLTFPVIGNNYYYSIIIIFIVSIIGSFLSETFSSNHQPATNGPSISTYSQSNNSHVNSLTSNIPNSAMNININSPPTSPSYTPENRLRRNIIVYIFTSLASSYILFEGNHNSGK
jgi:hypothetical protein